MTDDPNSQAAVRALRQAHVLLNELPSSGVRARILQAAASVGSTPPRSARFASGGASFLPRWFRGPSFAGAAALGFVVVLATSVALYVDRSKNRSEPGAKGIEIAQDTSGIAAVPAAPRVPGQTMNSDRASLVAEAGARSTAAQSSSEKERLTVPDHATGYPSSVSIARQNAASGAAASPANRALALQEAQSASAPIVSPSKEARVTSVPDWSRNSVGLSTARTCARTVAPAAATQGVGSDALQTKAGSPVYRSNPKSWLERIEALRKACSNDQADAELKLFHETYPQVSVPEDLRGP